MLLTFTLGMSLHDKQPKIMRDGCRKIVTRKTTTLKTAPGKLPP